MTPKEFLTQIDEPKVVRAIRELEAKTTGEIRIFVTRHTSKDITAEARARFKKLRMERTVDRNAVLIYFAPVSQEFAVVGDIGIHSRLDPTFWEKVAAEISKQLKAQKVTEAIEGGIRWIGDALALHFPKTRDDRNELSDRIARD